MYLYLRIYTLNHREYVQTGNDLIMYTNTWKCVRYYSLAIEVYVKLLQIECNKSLLSLNLNHTLKLYFTSSMNVAISEITF